MKPFAESCVQNREPIFQVIQPLLEGRKCLLEIGSGTGQHAVYFTPDLPGLTWQTSELPAYHRGILQWLGEAGEERILSPLSLEVCTEQHWSSITGAYDAVFSANTLHIMDENQVQCLMSNITRVMEQGALLLVYGPFNYHGEYTSDSNARFDVWLKSRDPGSGIKDFDWLDELAARAGLEHKDDIAMPANNRILVWQKK